QSRLPRLPAGGVRRCSRQGGSRRPGGGLLRPVDDESFQRRRAAYRRPFAFPDASELLRQPSKEDRLHAYLKEAARRPERASPRPRDTGSEVLLAIGREGETAARRYSEAFDNWSPPSFVLSEGEIAARTAGVDDELKAHIAFAQDQVSRFARLQLDSMHEF